MPNPSIADMFGNSIPPVTSIRSGKGGRTVGITAIIQDCKKAIIEFQGQLRFIQKWRLSAINLKKIGKSRAWPIADARPTNTRNMVYMERLV